MSLDIVLLSTADWDNPLWTNKQHVAMTLSKMGYRVFYIDSLGLRQPTLGRKDIGRMFRRFCRALRKPRKISETLWVLSPIMIPLQYIGWVRNINKIILETILWYWLRKLNLKPIVLWTYNPLTLEFLDVNKFDVLVYHCVDEIRAQPHMPVRILTRGEQQLTMRADLVFVTSLHLLETRKVWNNNTYYFPNVADIDHFSKALITSEIPQEFQNIPKPRIGFIGALSGYKVDFNLIQFIAKSRPDWSIVLIGEIGEGDPWTDPHLLYEQANIHLLGPRLYAELPNYLSGIDVAILPNNLNEYTQSMFPMKFFEYLASGKPIVSVDLPALQDFQYLVSIAKSYGDFVDRIQDALDGKTPLLEKRLAVAREYTYINRTKKMIALIQKILDNVTG